MSTSEGNKATFPLPVLLWPIGITTGQFHLRFFSPLLFLRLLAQVLVCPVIKVFLYNGPDLNLTAYTPAHCENHTPPEHLSYMTDSLKCGQPTRVM